MAAKNSTTQINKRTPETVKRSTHVLLIDADDGQSNFTTKNMSFDTLMKKTIETIATTPYSQTENDEVLLVNATSGPITVNLLPAVNRSGKQITIIKTDASVNAVTIDPNASETINGAATNSLASQYDKVKLVCDGSNWFIV
jgi:hypothetical protein